MLIDFFTAYHSLRKMGDDFSLVELSVEFVFISLIPFHYSKEKI